MRNLKQWILVSILILCSQVWADRDGWISSGGEIFQYARNPWFVKNVTDVKYCVELDAAGISASEADVKSSIRTAIAYWKKEMPAVYPEKNGVTNVATQNFIEQGTCDASADLRFKFGYNTLTTEEVEFLKDPKIYVGVSVRTEYDLVSLKGKGFIYISSDRGPHAYKNSGELIAEAWKSPKLLQYALIHELGHVFGIPHTGTGVMSEIFLNQLIHVRFSKFYLDHPLQPMLQEQSDFEVCSVGDFSSAFFMVDPTTACLKFQAEDPAKISWKVFASPTKTNPIYTQIGFVKLTSVSKADMAQKPAVVIQLPDQQKVFSKVDTVLGNTFMMGPLFMSRNTRGHFQTMTSHKPYQLQIQLSADSVIMTGVTGDRLGPVVTYTQFDLMKAILPPISFP